MKAPADAPEKRDRKSPAVKSDPIASAISDHARSIDQLAKAIEGLAKAMIGGSPTPLAPLAPLALDLNTFAAEAMQVVVPVAARTISSKRIRKEISSFFGPKVLPNKTMLRDLPDRAVAFEATLATKIRESDFFESYNIAFDEIELRGIFTVGELISVCQWKAEKLGNTVVG